MAQRVKDLVLSLEQLGHGFDLWPWNSKRPGTAKKKGGWGGRVYRAQEKISGLENIRTGSLRK